MTDALTSKTRFLNSVRKIRVDRPPIWLMRQAGRYLPEYRKIRGEVRGFLDLCYNPDLASEVTIQPIRRFQLDAAIIFSDILVIPHAAGSKLVFKEKEGPKLTPITNKNDVSALNFSEMTERLAPVYESIKITRQRLGECTAIIGFSGAPWTLATYMVEGGSSREFLKIRQLASENPELLQDLFTSLESSIVAHLISQIEAGADAVQIFDSWAGILNTPDFECWCLNPIIRICERIKSIYPQTPIIVFPRLAGIRYLNFLGNPAVDVISIDQTVPLNWAMKYLSPSFAIQGNLDPISLLVGGERLKSDVYTIMDAFGDQPGFIFNLGHGVIKDTNPENVEALCEVVRSWPGDSR
ncbi:MAG: uroporphyrinogen decarboxylase [Pseudomonadota bacterium]|nr:uroporphyrinogen decarboxylase [Pseudomonadota bacterium]